MVQKLRGSQIKREEAIVIKSPDTLRASRLKPVSKSKISREERERHEQQDNSPISHLDFAHQDDVLCEYPHRQGLMIVLSHETQFRQTHKERYERIFMTCSVVDACGVPKAVKARESRREHFN